MDLAEAQISDYSVRNWINRTLLNDGLHHARRFTITQLDQSTLLNLPNTHLVVVAGPQENLCRDIAYLRVFRGDNAVTGTENGFSINLTTLGTKSRLILCWPDHFGPQLPPHTTKSNPLDHFKWITGGLEFPIFSLEGRRLKH